jgi:hypothetical protein
MVVYWLLNKTGMREAGCGGWWFVVRVVRSVVEVVGRQLVAAKKGMGKTEKEQYLSDGLLVGDAHSEPSTIEFAGCIDLHRQSHCCCLVLLQTSSNC